MERRTGTNVSDRVGRERSHRSGMHDGGEPPSLTAVAAHTGWMVDLAGHRTARDSSGARGPGAASEYRTRWSTLCRTLLGHGGAAVVPPASPDPYLEELLAGDLVTLRSIPAPGWARSSGANSARP